MKSPYRTPARLTSALAVLICCTSPSSFGQTRSGTVDFERQVHPIIAAKCGICHSQEKRQGGLSLATYGDTLEGGRSGAAVRPGSSPESLLVRRVTGEVQPRMPLGGTPLSEKELEILKSWIDEGARRSPDTAPAKPKWEAPLSLTHPTVPAGTWRGWDAPIDRFTAAYLATQGVSEPKTVSDSQFARRAYLDIQGLLPPPEELRAFTATTDSRKREQLVGRLFAESDKYAEHWISFWNDLLRNDEGVSYHAETASRKSISPWLLASLKSNLPYNQFTSQLLNPKEPEGPEGFLIGVNWRGTVSASQSPAMQAAQNTAQVFLGINLKCNSCHDSFISRWKLMEAYRLASYFSPEDKLQLYRCDVAQKEFATPGFLYPELNRVPESQALAHRRAAAAASFTDPRNGRLPRTVVNRIWQRLMGHGIVADPDDMDGEPWSPELLDWLAADFADNGYDLKRLIATIVTSRTYQMTAVAGENDPPKQYRFRGPEVRRLTAEQFADAIGAITGEWHVYQPSRASGPGAYTREWRVASSPLTRALGRPIRDQVYSTRETQATTLQALELVNGESLTRWLSRGARKMLGELPPEPVAAFDRELRGRNNPDRSSFDVEISGAGKLWLLVQDTGSYSPERVEAVWSRAELIGPNGTASLSSLKPLDTSGLRTPKTVPSEDGVRVKTPSRVVYDIGGKGYTHLRGGVKIENDTITSDINPQVRFFVFTAEPNMERLTPVAPMTPLPAPDELKTASEVVDRVFWYALGRAPSPEERTVAEGALRDQQRTGRVSADGLADLLWAVLMKPEFQLVY